MNIVQNLLMCMHLLLLVLFLWTSSTDRAIFVSLLQKMLAKMACSVNKPNKQTILLDSATSKFLLPMSVRKVSISRNCYEFATCTLSFLMLIDFDVIWGT